MKQSAEIVTLKAHFVVIDAGVAACDSTRNGGSCQRMKMLLYVLSPQLDSKCPSEASTT
jgi:hypothetical protein